MPRLLYRSHLITCLLSALLVLAACGSSPNSQDEAPAVHAPAELMQNGTLSVVDPALVGGEIVTAGSSTVFPLSEAVAEMFIDEGFAGNLTIDSIGTGAGFERFCVAGETDISNASRVIKESEREACRSIGREPVEFRVGVDALAVVVNRNNSWLDEGVTLEQLARIFSDQAVNWSDVDPSWPNEAIQRFSPGTDSGTFDYFIEAVMDKVFATTDADAGKGEEAFLRAANLQQSEDDNVLVQGIEGNKNAIGFLGYAYFDENKSRLKAAPVDGVALDPSSVDDGSYPLARPLFLYSAASIITSKPQVAAFLDYYLTYVNEVIRDVGYFPESAEDLVAARMRILEMFDE